MYTKNTKIVCTLGPSTDSFTEISNLVSAGMDVARLNFSHGTYSHHEKILKNLRKVEKITGKRIGVIQDLQGPKIRVGKMPEEGIIIKKGETIKLTTKPIIGKSEKQTIIPVQYKRITKDVGKGDTIFIDDGLIQLKVAKKTSTDLTCKVIIGGIVKNYKGINCPTASISQNPITEKDIADLKWGLKHDMDYIAISFVKSKKDIIALRELIEKRGKKTKIIAKIERHEAIKNLKEIIKESDAVMVARGDLGIEIPAEQVPIVQKRIIALSNKHGKPVITATQVLQSMIENAQATRAEISDAANAVFDHTDAIMLSNESAIGKYPFKATKTLSKVALTVEKELQKDNELLKTIFSEKALSSTNASCLNACQLAQNLNADAIIVYTEEGYTARKIAEHRIYIPIITVTPSEKVARELTLVWGIKKVLIKKISGEKEKKQENILKFLKAKKEIFSGDKVVIISNASQKQSLIQTIKI